MKKSDLGVIIAGAVIGAVIGAIGANILVQQSAEYENNPKLTAGDGVKVGMGLLAVLKTISEAAQRQA
ncbi:MAG TPA: hypothetical protein PKD55_14360 [Bellilinea sp.]|nr:hypothetical protein [Bellilinea sp.]